MKSNLVIAAILVLGLGVVAWFLFLQPQQQAVTFQAGELLADGKGHFERKEYDLALEVLQQVPAGSPPKARALYYEGSSHMMLKDYEAAIISLEQSLALNNQDTGTLYALGVTSFKLGNLKLAKGYFAAVLAINPNDEQAKGLLDIMAGLERTSAAESDEEGVTNE